MSIGRLASLDMSPPYNVLYTHQRVGIPQEVSIELSWGSPPPYKGSSVS